MRRHALLAGGAALLALFVAAVTWAPAAAVCTYTGLTSGTTVSTGVTPSHFQFTQPTNYWTAIAVRGPATADWDLGVFSNTAPEPGCISGELASSTQSAGAVDFVVGDFNHAIPGSAYYPRVYLWEGVGDAQVQWDDGPDLLSVDVPGVIRDVPASKIIEVWDVGLAAGEQYAFHFNRWGEADLKIFLFWNPGGTYWASRNAAAVWSTQCFGYMPAASDWYAVVVVNENGKAGGYSLAVSSGLCTCPTAMTSGLPVGVGNPDVRTSLVQVDNFWTAIGIRPDPGSDYDLTVYSEATGGSPPECFSGAVAGSALRGSAPDFVVGDFFVNPIGDYFVHGQWYQGPGLAKMEWDSGRDFLYPNDPWTQRVTGPDDVLECWDVYLHAGVEYAFSIFGPGKLYLFRNAAGGEYWGGPADAVAQVTGGAVSYVVPATGYYGVVVVNETGESGLNFVRVGECLAPTELTSGVAVPLPASTGTYSVPQAWMYWAALGVRHLSEDFDIFAFGSRGGPVWDDCLKDIFAISNQSAGVDYVVGDFNHAPIQPFYAAARQFALTSGRGGALVEWDSGPDILGIGTPVVHRATGPNDLLECWDVALDQGFTYTIYFTRTAGVDAHVELFNSSELFNWAPRLGNIYSATGPGTFTAPSTDWYGLVVSNWNGGVGSYEVGIYPAGVDVPNAPVAFVTGIEAVAPNPTRASLRMNYALNRGGVVRFEAMDMAGRVVWRHEPGTLDAGRWNAEWSGADLHGRRLAPGLYFVRMLVDERPVSLKKVTLLE